MEYLMFVATDTDPEPEGTGGITVEEWVEEGERRGIRKQGQRLRPPEDATTVRVRKGELLVQKTSRRSCSSNWFSKSRICPRPRMLSRVTG